MIERLDRALAFQKRSQQGGARPLGSRSPLFMPLTREHAMEELDVVVLVSRELTSARGRGATLRTHLMGERLWKRREHRICTQKWALQPPSPSVHCLRPATAAAAAADLQRAACDADLCGDDGHHVMEQRATDSTARGTFRCLPITIKVGQGTTPNALAGLCGVVCWHVCGIAVPHLLLVFSPTQVSRFFQHAGAPMQRAASSVNCPPASAPDCSL